MLRGMESRNPNDKAINRTSYWHGRPVCLITVIHDGKALRNRLMEIKRCFVKGKRVGKSMELCNGVQRNAVEMKVAMNICVCHEPGRYVTYAHTALQ